MYSSSARTSSFESEFCRTAFSLPMPIPAWHEADKDYTVQCEYQLWCMAQRVSPKGIGAKPEPRRTHCTDEPILDTKGPLLIFGMDD